MKFISYNQHYLITDFYHLRKFFLYIIHDINNALNVAKLEAELSDLPVIDKKMNEINDMVYILNWFCHEPIEVVVNLDEQLKKWVLFCRVMFKNKHISVLLCQKVPNLNITFLELQTILLHLFFIIFEEENELIENNSKKNNLIIKTEINSHHFILSLERQIFNANYLSTKHIEKNIHIEIIKTILKKYKGYLQCSSINNSRQIILYFSMR